MHVNRKQTKSSTAREKGRERDRDGLRDREIELFSYRNFRPVNRRGVISGRREREGHTHTHTHTHTHSRAQTEMSGDERGGLHTDKKT